jgi:hypothetical protein
MAFWGIFSCKKDNSIIENKKISIKKETGYHDVSDPAENDIIYLVKFSDYNNKATKGGLQSILSIDNIQQSLLQPNAEYILENSPEETLGERIRSIQSDCEKPGIGWSDFKIINNVKPTVFKGYKAAEAEYEVVEYVDFLDKTVKKRIKRYAVFVGKDLWNIVLAPSSIQAYDTDMKEMNTMIETMKIK